MNIIIHGSDHNRVDQQLKKVKEKYKIDRNFIYMNATQVSMNELLMELDSTSLFDDLRMVCLDHASFLTSKDTTKYNVAQLIPHMEENEQVIFVLCAYTDKLDTRKKIVKQLISMSQVYSCKAWDDQVKKEFITNYLKQHDMRMDTDAYQWFLARCGMNPLQVENELDKLSIYSKHIALEEVQNLMVVEPMDDIFKMVDALFENNTMRLLAYYRNFREGKKEPLAILGLLASQIRFLFQVRVLKDLGYSQDAIAQELHAHPYRVKVNLQKASRFQASELLEKLSDLSNLDKDIKSGKVDKDEGFEQWILKSIL